MFGFRKKYTTKNSRRYKRLQADYLVRYCLVGSGEEPFLSNVKDISAGGLRFWSYEYIPEGSLLKISVWVPPIERTLQALGRVVRMRRAKEGDFFYLGVSFLEVDQEDQRALNEFIEEVSSGQTAEEAVYPLIRHSEKVKRHVPVEKV